MACVADHIHLIINWEVWPVGDGHTHELLKPEQVAVDTDIGSVPRNQAVIPPRGGGVGI